MNGAGNSFFVLDATKIPVEENRDQRSAFVRRICRETSGLHADGLFILEVDATADFRWDFYNADGSPAEMCGNAARCAVRFFLERLRDQPEVRFQTSAGTIVGTREANGEYRVVMPSSGGYGTVQAVTSGRRSERLFFVNTGVPHLVLNEKPDAARARTLRFAPELGAAGANITFANRIAKGVLEAVTFERGVEDFTLACGTGAVAAAAMGRAEHPELRRFEIRMPGGNLTVTWSENEQAELTGAAEFDFEVKLGE